nr:heavy metal sensor histidine kinase [Saccharophagus sp. K07]
MDHFNIAHELRTPLTNLATQTQVGLGLARTLEEYRELLYSNLEEQERLTKMVNDMLWLAQSENGLLKPNWELLDLRQEVEATFEFFEALAEDKKITLAVGGDRVNVMADRSMLRRVISNLLSNALRYTPENETINVTVEGVGNQAQITIENPGQGIPEDHLPKLFDRFYRVDPSRQRQSEGAGLGLAIVKSIIEAHDGNVEVSSEMGTTRFVISLPTHDKNAG